LTEKETQQIESDRFELLISISATKYFHVSDQTGQQFKSRLLIFVEVFRLIVWIVRIRWRRQCSKDLIEAKKERSPYRVQRILHFQLS